ncbi:rhodanese-like domain-containing protein [Planococcus sp. APC 3906]|uniref:rhodanese-like domain-containing protein n=1 Tax=Planococcus sp. APC 3906 TaxID=3035194 RepID=UPI0025B496CF|nr:rhodanese-like domain-containing protein [Planococcus sp. APC 3906]MDN3450024.1 rhodanese-like domain-containing protein [Planococcus sp. APC 3906]
MGRRNRVMNKRLMLLLAVLGVLLLSACGQGAGYETIQIDEVAAKQEAGYTVLDVREAYEYEQAHIPGAENKPLSLLQSGDFEGLQEDAKYVVICQSGNRSKQASDLLLEEGYDFVNVAQGMSSWEGAVE